MDIGEYFGVKKPYRSDVASVLDEVLRVYQVSSNKRTPQTKGCLDYLCDLLRVPKLQFPTFMPVRQYVSQSIFLTKKEMVDKILAIDDSIKLMSWVFDTTKNDREYALRLAASKEGMSQCLLFLLSFTSPTKEENFQISLISQGETTGQCALHRAIRSGSSYIVSCLIECPSNDILKQLLVKDISKQTPIDYLQTVIDKYERNRMISIILQAIHVNKTNQERALPANEMELLIGKLENMKSISMENTY